MPAVTYLLPSETSCCVCNSADTFTKCSTITSCGDGYSEKLFASNISCSLLASQQNCPTWHDAEIISASVDLSTTETIAGDCCCLYLPGTGDCNTGCPEAGSGSIVTDFVSSSVTFGSSTIVVDGITTITETTDCQDGSPGTTTYPGSFTFYLPTFNFCCSTTPGICSNSQFGISSIPESVSIGGSEIGECLSEKGFECAGVNPDYCVEGDSGNSYTPDISASLIVTFVNRYGQTITTKEIYPDKIECPIQNYISCCEYLCSVGSYTYQYTLSGQVTVRVGNE